MRAVILFLTIFLLLGCDDSVRIIPPEELSEQIDVLLNQADVTATYSRVWLDEKAEFDWLVGNFADNGYIVESEWPWRVTRIYTYTDKVIVYER